MAIATWNPSDKHADITLSIGDLTATQTAVNTWRSVRSTLSVSSGKYYWEITADSTTGDMLVGVGTSSFSLANYCGSDANSYGWYAAGTKYNNAGTTSYTPTYNIDGTIIGVALDLDNGKIWWAKNGTWTGDPVAGTGEAFSGLSGIFFAGVSVYALNQAFTANFGATAFSYAIPAGFESGLSDFTGQFTGTVLEQNAGVSRTIYLHRRDTGVLIDTITSSGNGSYTLSTTHSGAHYIVCLDDDPGESYNDLILGNMIPTTVSG